MEIFTSTPFIVVGALLFVGLLIVVFRKSPKKIKAWQKTRQLRKDIMKIRRKIEQQEERIEDLQRDYRIEISIVKYIPENIDEKITSLEDEAKKMSEKLAEILAPVVKQRWQKWINFWYKEVPRYFLKQPKIAPENLPKLLKKLKNYSRKLHELLEDLASALGPPKDKNGSSTTHLSTIRWYNKIETGRIETKRKKQEKKEQLGRIESAKKELKNALDEARLQETGGDSITMSAPSLDFDLVNAYTEGILERVAELEEEDNEEEDNEEEDNEEEDNTDATIDTCRLAAANLNTNFKHWAQKILDRHMRLKEIQEPLVDLENHFKIKSLPVEKSICDISDLLQTQVPDIWHLAEWEFLENSLTEIDKDLNELDSAIEEAFQYGARIEALETKFQVISAKEKRLKEKHKVPKPYAKGWPDSIKKWKDQAFALWVGGQYKELDRLLSDFESAWRTKDVAVGSILQGLNYDGSETFFVPKEKQSVFAKSRKSFLASSPENKPVDSASDDPGKKIAGKRVKATTLYSDEILEVDPSLIGQGYKLVEEPINDQEQET